MASKFSWPCRVTAQTTVIAGESRRNPEKINYRTHRINRVVEGAADIEAGMMRAILEKSDPGEFLGVEITATTPSGEKLVRILDVECGKYKLVSPK